MKKSITLILALALAVSLAACEGGDVEPTLTKPTRTSPSTVQTEAPAPAPTEAPTEATPEEVITELEPMPEPDVETQPGQTEQEVVYYYHTYTEEGGSTYHIATSLWGGEDGTTELHLAWYSGDGDGLATRWVSANSRVDVPFNPEGMSMEFETFDVGRIGDGTQPVDGETIAMNISSGGLFLTRTTYLRGIPSTTNYELTQIPEEEFRSFMARVG
jgi:hypothetical protein